jgi:hypothetical protein
MRLDTADNVERAVQGEARARIEEIVNCGRALSPSEQREAAAAAAAAAVKSTV